MLVNVMLGIVLGVRELLGFLREVVAWPFISSRAVRFC